MVVVVVVVVVLLLLLLLLLLLRLQVNCKAVETAPGQVHQTGVRATGSGRRMSHGAQRAF
eukprot:COSAG02_NODE_334_length_24367_cov_6.715634_13_plen_60_part_00